MSSTDAIRTGVLKKHAKLSPRDVSRFYILSKEGVLSYKKKQGDKKLAGTLDTILSVSPYYDPPKKHGLLINTATRKHTLFTTQEEADLWIKALLPFLPKPQEEARVEATKPASMPAPAQIPDFSPQETHESESTPISTPEIPANHEPETEDEGAALALDRTPTPVEIVAPPATNDDVAVEQEEEEEAAPAVEEEPTGTPDDSVEAPTQTPTFALPTPEPTAPRPSQHDVDELIKTMLDELLAPESLQPLVLQHKARQDREAARIAALPRVESMLNAVFSPDTLESLASRPAMEPSAATKADSSSAGLFVSEEDEELVDVPADLETNAGPGCRCAIQ